MSATTGEGLDGWYAWLRERGGRRDPAGAAVIRRRLLVDGIVQGVGFRPFVYNLARERGPRRVRHQHQRRRGHRDPGRRRGPGPLRRAAARPRPRPWPGSSRSTAEDVDRCRDDDAFVIVASREHPRHQHPHPARRGHLRRLPARDPRPRTTAATATPSPTAPTAARAGPSSAASPTTGPSPPWPTSPCAPPARPSTTTRATGASTPSPTPAPSAGPRVWLEGPVGADRRPTTARWPRPPTALAAARSWPSRAWAASTWPCGPTTRTRWSRLRRRKDREAKPLAVMAADLDAVAPPGRGRPAEEAALLASPAAPIVLLERHGRRPGGRRRGPGPPAPGRHAAPTRRCTTCCSTRWPRTASAPWS